MSRDLLFSFDLTSFGTLGSGTTVWWALPTLLNVAQTELMAQGQGLHVRYPLAGKKPACCSLKPYPLMISSFHVYFVVDTRYNLNFLAFAGFKRSLLLDV